MAPKPDRFETASKDFDLALQRAKAAVDAATDPAIKNLVFALANFSRSVQDTLIVIVGQLDEIDRKVHNVEARLDGKKGPFDLRMRK